ncbi:MAG: hypothetical protein J6F30_14080 [Cellulosilyticum sp.]|nr:hypothetical protein [Cellulosilyticum sp.]
MRLYHGTTAQFDEFSMDFMGEHSTSEGLGLYFSDSKNVAKGYAYDTGRIFTIEFEGKKAISAEKITFTRKEIETLVLELHKSTNLLEDYNDISYYGFDRVFNETLESLIEWNESDVELICELANTCGSKKEVLRVVYEILGYDHCATKATWGNDIGQEYVYTIFATDIFDIVEIENYEDVEMVI